MSDICEHDTFRDICAVCHRITVITKLTKEITALRAENERLRAALRGVIRVADRKTVDFDEARAALEEKP